MKSEFISKEKQFVGEINWNNKQLFKHIRGSEVIVLSNGKHEGDTFEAVELKCSAFHAKEEIGEFDTTWLKQNFAPCAPGEQVILTA